MHDWLAEKRAKCEMRFESIPFAESKEWIIEGDKFRHKTGAFFSVEGVRARAACPSLDGVCQPIINQPEVGILGFVLMPDAGSYRWLVQAKAEPGNVGGVQLAPTVQATHSNYTRKHGGAPTLYLDFFVSQQYEPTSDSLQSEQGTRFLRKFNRNATVVVNEQVDVANAHFCWLTAADMRTALQTSFAINTDARSVMVSAPWRFLSDTPQPFHNACASGMELLASYKTSVRGDIVDRVKACLEAMRREAALEVSPESLSRLTGWRVDADSISPHSKEMSPLAVRQYSVWAPEREKAEWDQPLVLSSSPDSVQLLAQERDGVLHFLLRPAYEVGLTGGVEFGPSFKLENAAGQPDWLEGLCAGGHLETLVEVDQSDEGGRFMQACSRYAVRRLATAVPVPEDPGNLWVTLGELEALCQTPKLLTNEARSVISLLLAFA
jgi:oxidase EvaA